MDITSAGTCINGSVDFFLQGSQRPQALFSSSADTAMLSTNVSFTNNSINASDYWWDFGDGMGSSDPNSFNNYASTGTYTVTLAAVGSLCPDTAFFSKEITITEEQTMGIKKAEGESKNMFIGRDLNGYFVKFEYTYYRDASVSVTDILGQKIIAPVELKSITNEKIYIPMPPAENKIFIISSVTTAGEKTFKKIIN